MNIYKDYKTYSIKRLPIKYNLIKFHLPILSLIYLVLLLFGFPEIFYTTFGVIVFIVYLFFILIRNFYGIIIDGNRYHPDCLDNYLDNENTEKTCWINVSKNEIYY
ncbi:hypothetical protein LBMAG53_21830 [Planctomycetota bacterium]|nr:hypothetical protein LBMAG53_21830 [Planctomycetota bacterium]